MSIETLFLIKMLVYKFTNHCPHQQKHKKRSFLRLCPLLSSPTHRHHWTCHLPHCKKKTHRCRDLLIHNSLWCHWSDWGCQKWVNVKDWIKYRCRMCIYFFFRLASLPRVALQREHQISLKQRKMHWIKCNLEFRKCRIKDCE